MATATVGPRRWGRSPATPPSRQLLQQELVKALSRSWQFTIRSLQPHLGRGRTLLQDHPALASGRQRLFRPSPEKRTLRKQRRRDGVLEVRRRLSRNRPDHRVLAQQHAVSFASAEGVDREIELRPELSLHLVCHTDLQVDVNGRIDEVRAKCDAALNSLLHYK